MALRGWALYPPTWPRWISYLASLPRDIPAPFCAFPALPWVDVFTDGSCLWQSQPALRLAAWSAVVVQPFSASWRFGVHGLLGASFLPGVIQSAYRAELYALAFVLHWAAASHQPVRVWSDCLGVVNRLLLLLWGKRCGKPNTVNSDLWTWILQSVQELGVGNVKIFKVPAHQEIRHATSLKQAWLIWNNGAADRQHAWLTAVGPMSVGNFGRSTRVNSFTFRTSISEVVALHLAVAELSVKTASSEEQDHIVETVRRPRRIFHRFYDAGTWNGGFLPQLVQRYYVSFARKVTSWWLARTGTGANVIWMPLILIYIDFQLTFGCPGPMKVQRSWVESSQRPYLQPERFKHSQRLRWFRTFLSYFWKTAQIFMGAATCRPDSEVIQAFVPSFSVPWDAWCFAQAETWLSSHLVKPCVRAALELRNIPLARLDAAMATSTRPNSG